MVILHSMTMWIIERFECWASLHKIAHNYLTRYLQYHLQLTFFGKKKSTLHLLIMDGAFFVWTIIVFLHSFLVEGWSLDYGTSLLFCIINRIC